MSKPLILELKEKVIGKILYEDETGTNGNVTFSEQITENSEIEIVYCKRRTDGTSIFKSTGRIPYVEGMDIALDIIHYTNDSTQLTQTKYVSVNNNGLTIKGENAWNSASGVTSSNTIYITKVIKYK